MAKTSEKITKLIESDDVVLFMKGTPDFPQCGFSANVVGILNYFGIKFSSFNVLKIMNLERVLKVFLTGQQYPKFT